jgi:DNA-binding NarL/FixJ family response regulator
MATGARRTVLLADRDANTCALVAALADVLDLVVETVDTGAQALAALDRELPCVTLLALDLTDPPTYEVLRRVRERFGERLPVAVLSAENAQPREEIAALLIGADDYYTKPLRSDQLTAKLRRMLSHAAAYEPSASPQLTTLTRREREVLGHLVEGRSSPEIAALLCISRKTTATHIEHVLAKLGARSQAQAVAFAVRDGILNGAASS